MARTQTCTVGYKAQIDADWETEAGFSVRWLSLGKILNEDRITMRGINGGGTIYIHCNAHGEGACPFKAYMSVGLVPSFPRHVAEVHIAGTYI